MDDFQLSLFANFDSANMARYERVYKQQVTSTAVTNNNSSGNNNTNPSNTTNSFTNNNTNSNGKSSTNNNNTDNQENVDKTLPNTLSNLPNQFQPKYDIEFNVWTRPDCQDAPVGPNGNRTWFYFGIRGGHGKWIKFNLMNLNKQGRLFEMGMLPVFKTVPGHEKWARIYSRPTWQNLDTNFQMSFIHRIPDKRDTVTYFAFCFPFSYDECQNMFEKLDDQFKACKQMTPEKCDPDAIYYHRELLCHSLDKRRIDLITISGCNQMTYTREPRFDPDKLFPILSENDKRCYKFDKKRVFILTSRVHPGETPASFVFNGFLEFILRKDDPRAKALRRCFVFKLIPMLNPDGVARGYYRTDQLGINLNRVYLDPSFKFAPSIYACKSLIVYHHVNNRTSKDQDGLNFDNLFKLEFDKEDLAKKTLTPSKNNNNNNGNATPRKKENKILTDEPTMYYRLDSSSSSSSETSNHNNNNAYNSHDFSDLTKLPKSYSFINPSESKLGGGEGHTNRSLDTMSKTAITNKKKSNKVNSYFNNDSLALNLMPIASAVCPISKTIVKTQQDLDDDEIIRKISSDSDSCEDLNEIGAGGPGDKLIGNENSDEDAMPEFLLHAPSDSSHLNDPKLTLINPLWSGIAFYVDLHGHAAKRGCFIYGNSIENELYQVENVLFTKLIAFNTQHFDFDGCNFSVRNMYMKDKREGLSKEGSGRVAMYKKLGLIHSYTLECCYASGKVMNSIAPATNSTNFANIINGGRPPNGSSGTISPPLHTDLPPKFVPEHYADVGKALAIAALDIIEMNQFTRIPNTSFGSLEAVRNWVKFFIRSKNGGGIVTATSTIGASLNGNQQLNNQTLAASSSNPSNTNSNFNASSNRKQSISINQRSNAQDRKNSNSKSLTPNNNMQKSQNNSTDINSNTNKLASSSLSNNSSSKLTKPTTNTSQPKKATLNSNLNRIVVSNGKMKSLAQRHSLATMTPANTQTVSTQTSENRINDTPPLVKPYKNNFVSLPPNASTSSTIATAANNRFFSGQTKFRTNLKKMKEIENINITSPTISIPLPSSQPQKKLSQSSTDTDANIEDSSKLNNRWNFDENTSENSEHFKLNQKQQQLTRKLLPINKANVQQILSSNVNNTNQVSCSIITNGTNNASNIIFFNKLNSPSTKNFKLNDASSRPTTSHNNNSNGTASAFLELDPSVLSGSSPRSTKMISPKFSNGIVKTSGSLKDPFLLNSLMNGGVAQQEMMKINNNLNFKLLHEKTLLKQKPINFGMRKIQSNVVTNGSSDFVLANGNKTGNVSGTDNNGVLTKK